MWWLPVRTSAPRTAHAHLIALLHWTRWGVVFGGSLLLLALMLAPHVLAPAPPRPSTHLTLDILPVRPGGPAQNYAAYVPATALSLPARSLATITIRNFDLDATPLPADSPYWRVTGTVGGIAYADGVPYTALPRTQIAHTFTVPDLGLNVPIPSRSAHAGSYSVVTFSFPTGAPGTHLWQCHDPCGDGPDGLGGPMADVDYMRGTLTIDD
ncbi:MAG TPA: hypothetical protein VGR57_17915 [Ktedonobacterales bacterium]|nr:hypothetical protein [Ktedonobacterales bacterium]